MPDNDPGKSYNLPARLRTPVLALLPLGVALSLAGNVYQFVKGEHMSRDMALMQRNLQTQITRLSDATSGAFDVTQQRFEAVKKLQEDATAALASARSEARRSNSAMANRLETENQDLEQRNQELRNQLADLKRDTGAGLETANAHLRNASARLDSTNARLDTASTRLNQVSAQADRNAADLKRVGGDLSVMNGNIATHARQLAALHESGDRNYFEFDLFETKTPTRIADIEIAIRKTDPKRNLYTLDLYADDQVIQRKDRTINEPVPLYVHAGRQPYEIVVKQVKQNEVIGYLVTPKVRPAPTRASGAPPQAGAAPETARR